MTLSRRSFLQLGGAAATVGTITGSGIAAHTWAAPKSANATADVPLNVHLLNRITWGPTPTHITEIDALGYEAYLDQQLNPEAIDDSATDTRLRRFNAVLDLSLTELYALGNAEGRAYEALIGAMVIRAIYSRRQLLERVVEFWSDHFNAAGEEIIFEMLSYYNNDIRRNALGNFRSLVLATAKAPAMLVYLDNFVNIAEHPNENYGRELLELHTMGVDGGYTEEDVVNVARAFTGWTVTNGVSHFNPATHDTNPKRILGRTLPAGRGVEDGLHVIDLLVEHPATAQFISRKLCVHFVSDTPPQSLVDSTAAVFMANNAEIKPVLRHLFTSDEFKAAAGQKLRRPLTFFVAAARATGTSVVQYEAVYEMLATLGQVPYAWLPPNGYPPVAAPWTTTNGLLARWNIAMRMTEAAQGGEFTGMRVALHDLVDSPTTVDDLVTQVSKRVFGYSLPAAARQTFIDFASDNAGPATPVTAPLLSRKLGTLFALMLASPHFQWH